MPFPSIQTPRLQLSAFAEADAPDLFEIFSNSAVTEFYDCHPFSELAQAERLVHRYTQQLAQRLIVDFRWAISVNGDSGKKLIGTCGIHFLHKEFQSLEVGYDLHPDQWGKGYAAEAVLGMIRYCVDHSFPFAVNRVTATTNLEAVRSIRVLRKLGFTEEGVLRQYGFWMGSFHDVRLFSLLKSEVPAAAVYL